MWVTQDDIDEDCQLGLFACDSPKLDEDVAINYCKGTLIEELKNNPLRGYAKVLASFDHKTQQLKTYK
jgi:hypothetical protein